MCQVRGRGAGVSPGVVDTRVVNGETIFQLGIAPGVTRPVLKKEKSNDDIFFYFFKRFYSLLPIHI